MTKTDWSLKPGTRCLCLGRVSTKGQAGPEKVSLGQQADATRAFALTLAPADVTELREDPGVSGLDPDRLEQIVVACERARRPRSAPGFVVVFDMSRFTRLGTQAAMYYLERLSRAGWTLRDTTLKLLGTQGSEMSDAIQITVACEVAAELIRGFERKVFPAMAKYADAGRFIGGKPPLGYAIEDKRLVPGDPNDIKKVRAAFKAYAGGATLDAVAKLLGTRHASTARQLLANPAYVGDLAWGKRNGSKWRGGKEGAHRGIVDRALWEAAQARLTSPNPRYAHGRVHPVPKGALPYVLSKLARCTCEEGRFLTGGGGAPSKATEAQRLRLRTYQCKACRGRVKQTALEAAVFGAIAEFYREADKSGQLERRLERWVKARLAEAMPDAAAKERADIEARKARLLGLVEDGDAAAVARVRELNARLRELDQARSERPDPRAIKAEAQAWLQQTREAVRTGAATPQAANTTLANLRPLIAAVIFDRETRTVEVNFAPWPHTTNVTLVEGRRRKGDPYNSGYSASWRARASHRGAKRRT